MAAVKDPYYLVVIRSEAVGERNAGEEVRAHDVLLTVYTETRSLGLGRCFA